MFQIRQVLISTLIFAVVPPSVVGAASDAVQYVGGTVKSIPVNSTGTFNFDDAKEFRFVYNGTAYQLPYDQIISTNIERAEMRRVMHVFPAVSPVASRRKQVLVINYKESSGALGSVNFELAAYKAADAQETIAAKRSPISPAAAAAASNKWWGDTYWKTTRNKPQWDAQAALAAQSDQKAQAQSEQATPPVQPGQLAPGGTK